MSRDVAGVYAVPDGVHAVAQGDVLDEERLGHRATAVSGVRGDALGDPQRGRGHDVEVAGVGRQVVRGALDLEEDRHLGGRRAGAVGQQGVHRLVRPGSG